MHSPMVGRSNDLEPCALDPAGDTALALRGLHVIQVAWPFEEIEPNQDSDFLSRWPSWFDIEALAAGGVLEVAEERRVRGAVERSYRLRSERASIDPKLAATMSTEEHRSAFAVAMAALIAEFGAYLDREDSDPANDPVGYRQHAVWLDPDELDELNGELRRALLAALDNKPAPGRTQYLISPILFPISNGPTGSP